MTNLRIKAATRTRSVVLLSVSLLLLSSLFATEAAHAQSVQLRPVDRATVRLISLRGVDGRIEHGEVLHLGVQVSHGTGVFVQAGGWIATAAHVIDDSDYLVVVLPGEERARPAEVVFRSSAHDLALVRVRGETPAPVRPNARTRLRIGQDLHGTGYPLDPRERWPAAVSGEVGRPLNDGRVQLSMSVNPGNSGGPIITEAGELVGILTQRADPTQGAQGIAIMEPIAPIVEALREHRGDPASELATESATADLFLELIEARSQPDSGPRLTRLHSAQPDSQPDAALWIVEAVELQRRQLSIAGVSSPSLLNAEQLSEYEEAGRLARSWISQAQTGSPELAARYQALSQARPGNRNVAANPRESDSSVSGPVMGPSPWAPETTQTEESAPTISFGFGARGGLTLDDLPEREPVVGGLVGVSADLRLFLAYTPYYRFAATLGGSLPMGSWRERSLIGVLGAGGLRMEFGPRSTGVFIRGAFTPGYLLSEGREHGISLGYEAALGMTLGSIQAGVLWQELKRSADSPLRTLQLTLSWELIP